MAKPAPHPVDRKTDLLTRGHPASALSIADAVVIKDRNLFLVTRPDGNIQAEGDHAFGLYLGDCRFLRHYLLRIAGHLPVVLASTSERSFKAMLQLTNPDILLEDGTRVERQSVGIRWVRRLDWDSLSLHDEIHFENYLAREVEIPISLEFDAGFEDIFAVRGLVPLHLGKIHPPVRAEDHFLFSYSGADGIARQCKVSFGFEGQYPSGRLPSRVTRLKLPPRSGLELKITLALGPAAIQPGSPAEEARYPRALRRLHPPRRGLDPDRADEEWIHNRTHVHSNSLELTSLLERSFRDLRMLGSSLHGEEFFAAGIPWFCTLFGRDSLITAIQTLAFEPGIAGQTLQLLARYQGTRVDAWRNEEPGKILHEVRTGELARLGEVPHSPYYGTVDATPLFLMLCKAYVSWTGDLALIQNLLPHIERALHWMDEYGDPDHDGYLEYTSEANAPLIHQGWKDSGRCIVNSDGTEARAPIAMVEAQAYSYAARRGIAAVFRVLGRPQRALQLEAQAQHLRERFNRDFWMEEAGTYALALQGDKTWAAAIASNAGHALWCGIADPEKARRTAKRLMADDLFSGWGLRTLSALEAAFNPIGYHIGSVWPHDTAIAAAGFKRYGLDSEAQLLLHGLVDASFHFQHQRLPELFAGYGRQDYEVPVHYPMACHPQAWAAGSVPYLLSVLLGFRPEAHRRTLTLVRPTLPSFASHLEFHELQVGKAKVDLRFVRHHGEIQVEVLRQEGPLDVRVLR